MLGTRCYRLALLVRVSGTSGCGRACTCWRPLTSRGRTARSPCGERVRGIHAKSVVKRAVPLTRLARLRVLCGSPPSPAGRESAAARGAILRSAYVWHYHDHAIESAFAVSHRQDDRSGCLRALHNRLRIFARILTSPLQCWHRANLHHTCSLMLPPGFHRVGYPGDKNEHANRT